MFYSAPLTQPPREGGVELSRRGVGYAAKIANCRLPISGRASNVSNATTFQYTYTFDLGPTISGTFEGVATGNIIQNISAASVFLNGIPFTGNPNLTIFSFNSATFWTPGGAYLSFDGTENNFMFTDAPPSNVVQWTDQFFSITGAAAILPGAPPEIAYGAKNITINGFIGLGDFPPNSSWQIAAVPGPIVGAGLPGLLMAIAGFIGWRRCPCRKPNTTGEQPRIG
jgi:hypothetical protein